MKAKKLVEYFKTFNPEAELFLYVFPKGCKNKYYKGTYLEADDSMFDICLDLDNITELSTQQGDMEIDADLGIHVYNDDEDLKVNHQFYEDAEAYKN